MTRRVRVTCGGGSRSIDLHSWDFPMKILENFPRWWKIHHFSVTKKKSHPRRSWVSPATVQFPAPEESPTRVASLSEERRSELKVCHESFKHFLICRAELLPLLPSKIKNISQRRLFVVRAVTALLSLLVLGWIYFIFAREAAQFAGKNSVLYYYRNSSTFRLASAMRW